MTIITMNDSEISHDESKRLDELDSTMFGHIQLQSTDSSKDRLLLCKAIKILERKLEQLVVVKEDDLILVQQQAAIYCKLGHINLLANDFPKALSAYQKYYRLCPDNWKDASFLYGLGLVYYHFNAYMWASRIFERLLYTDRNFSRASEVHLRLGLIFKVQKNWSAANKHLNLALIDSSPCSLSKPEIKFHIAHCSDIQDSFSTARLLYSEIIENCPQLTNQLKALVRRQLGWLHHRAEAFGDRNQRENTAIEYLKQSTDLDPNNGLTWYYLGRCYSSIPGRAHDAFIAYRHSIDKSESSADTWCSIGVLYQQQHQPMDALQAYICAVQLDRSHPSAWLDLGLLYEQQQLYRDALTCFKQAAVNKPAQNIVASLNARIKLLEGQLENAPASLPKSSATLPPLEEAFKLPIPAELTARQTLNQQQKIKQAIEGSILNMKLADDTCPPRPQPMSPAQINMMHLLQQSQHTLNANELNTLKTLQHHYAMSQQIKVDPMALTSHQTPPAAAGQPQGFTSLPDLQHTTTGAGLQVSDEELVAYLGSFSDGKQDFADELLGPLGGGSSDTNIQDIQNDPMLSDASFPQPPSAHGIPSSRIQDSTISSSKDHVMVMTSSLPQLTQDSNGQFALLTPPPPLSLVGPCGLDGRKMTASEIIEACRPGNRGGRILPEKCPLPVLPDPQIFNLEDAKNKMLKVGSLSSHVPHAVNRGDAHLLIPTPSVTVESKKEAGAPELQEFCFNNPVVLIRGLSAALKLDLGLFSTKTLVETAPEQQVEVRTQLLLPPDENTDQFGSSCWKCDSHRSFSTISKYAQYQAQSFQVALKEEQERIKTTSKGGNYVCLEYQPFNKRRKGDGQHKILKFGTNVDLSDPRKWGVQLKELKKLPSFLRLAGTASNMLGFLGHTVLGMNTLQLYMKVPGSRTPGHQENNNFSSVNVNIGPGDCQWYSVPYEYWGEIQKLVEKNGMDYLKGAWWPPVEELAALKIPVYKFTQKPGDLVWVGPGTVHWVQSLGWCNNIAWNVGPVTACQLSRAIERYEWNKLTCYKSIVPVMHLTWQLAKMCRFSDVAMFVLVKKILLLTLCHTQLQTNYLHAIGKDFRHHPRLSNEVAHYCSNCEVEVWNILMVTEQQQKLHVHCFECSRRIDPTLERFIVLNQYTSEDMSTVFDQCQLHAKAAGVIA